VWRPEADPEPEVAHHVNPFGGVETYVLDEEQDADRIVMLLKSAYPAWKFHVEPLVTWQGSQALAS